jgi:hypothetical protein
MLLLVHLHGITAPGTTRIIEETREHSTGSRAFVLLLLLLLLLGGMETPPI